MLEPCYLMASTIHMSLLTPLMTCRLGDRVLAAVPPMSKEERRRAFAEAAAAAEETRRQADHQQQQHWQQFPQWPAEGYPQVKIR